MDAKKVVTDKKEKKTREEKKARHRDKSSQIRNYFAIVAIAPGVLSIMAYEFLDYSLNWFRLGRTDYDPIVGLGMLIPMTFMMELVTFFFALRMQKKVEKLNGHIQRIAKGNYGELLDAKGMAPFKEITESVNAMSKDLASVDTLRKDFIGDFSHEFKTPIVSINGFAELLLEEDLTEEERREYLQIIADESKRLSDMAMQTMLLSRLDTQTQIIKQEIFSLDEQIKQKIILLSRSWEEKKIRMQVDLAPMTYCGDPEILSHVWINLLNNSIKFTPDGGTISVSGGLHDDGSFRVEISDTGKGMTPDQCEKIFNRYYQADSSHATKGLGLGLSIVKRIMELYHGSISVTSEPGKGSCFSVILPPFRKEC